MSSTHVQLTSIKAFNKTNSCSEPNAAKNTFGKRNSLIFGTSSHPISISWLELWHLGLRDGRNESSTANFSAMAWQIRLQTRSSAAWRCWETPRPRMRRKAGPFIGDAFQKTLSPCSATSEYWYQVTFLSQTLVYLDSTPKLTVSHHQPPAIFFNSHGGFARVLDIKTNVQLHCWKPLARLCTPTWLWLGTAGALFLVAGYGILPGVGQLFGVLCISLD